MCIGIAIVGVVPVDGSPIQFYGRPGNSSHDSLLSESVPVELHNRSFKVELIFPNEIRLDAPDEACRNQAQELGIAEMKFGVALLKPEIFAAVCSWLRDHPMGHDLKTMQGANLSRANLSWAYLSRANLSEAYLSEAYLSGANLSGANLSRANLFRANLSEAYLSRANLSGANLSGAYLSGADLSRAYLSGANLSRANLSGEQKRIAKGKGALGVD